MSTNIQYKHEKKYKIKTETINRIQATIVNKSKEIIQSSTKNDNPAQKHLEFIIKTSINGFDATIEIIFKISKSHIDGLILTLLKGHGDFNEINLKYYTLELIEDIIGGEHNNEYKKYTVRTYSKTLNSHPLQEEVLINSDFKFLIKPLVWTSKEEPLTEQVLFIDTEIEAISIEHARSIAYNHTSNTNAYLSVLLDTGFEMLSSEFRFFITKEEENIFINRYRTGFIDSSLGLIVKDNHYGLKDITDTEHVDSLLSGKTVINYASEKDDGGLDFHSTQTFDTISNNNFLENLFSKHTIKRENNNKKKSQFIPIKEAPHFPTEKILMPSDARKYFKGIASLPADKKEAFLSSCRLYNISSTLGRSQTTLAQSYKVCAIETLANFEKISFSEFMIKYSNENFDKKLCDYFYSVRSGHFHSGKFYFDEYEVNFQREIALTFNEKTADYINFNRYVRIAIIKWIKAEILNKP